MSNRPAYPRAALESLLLNELSMQLDCAHVTHIHIAPTGHRPPAATWEVIAIDRTGPDANLPIYGTKLFAKLTEMQTQYDMISE